MKSKWKEKSAVDKILIIIRIIASVVISALCLLQLCDVWDKALAAAVPLAGVNILIQSIQEYKAHKVSAIFGYCCAAFIFIVSMVVLFVK